MTTPPARPSIYHITHIDNLPSILRDGGLHSDSEIGRRRGPVEVVGIEKIKRRRLQLPVRCWPGDCVGDYVPFYFCPRSVMLYILHMANHEELTYRGGQRPIVHLELDLHDAIAWAARSGGRWAISLANAGAKYNTEFRNTVEGLEEIDWAAVEARDWRQPEVKEAKQAEFLLRDFAPWTLVKRVGVHSAAIQRKVAQIVGAAAHQPPDEVLRHWYY